MIPQLALRRLLGSLRKGNPESDNPLETPDTQSLPMSGDTSLLRYSPEQQPSADTQSPSYAPNLPRLSGQPLSIEDTSAPDIPGTLNRIDPNPRPQTGLDYPAPPKHDLGHRLLAGLKTAGHIVPPILAEGGLNQAIWAAPVAFGEGVAHPDLPGKLRRREQIARDQRDQMAQQQVDKGQANIDEQKARAEELRALVQERANAPAKEAEMQAERERDNLRQTYARLPSFDSKNNPEHLAIKTRAAQLGLTLPDRAGAPTPSTDKIVGGNVLRPNAQGGYDTVYTSPAKPETVTPDVGAINAPDIQSETKGMTDDSEALRAAQHSIAVKHGLWKQQADKDYRAAVQATLPGDPKPVYKTFYDAAQANDPDFVSGTFEDTQNQVKDLTGKVAEHKKNLADLNKEVRVSQSKPRKGVTTQSPSPKTHVLVKSEWLKSHPETDWPKAVEAATSKQYKIVE